MGRQRAASLDRKYQAPPPSQVFLPSGRARVAGTQDVANPAVARSRQSFVQKEQHSTALQEQIQLLSSKVALLESRLAPPSVELAAAPITSIPLVNPARAGDTADVPAALMPLEEATQAQTKDTDAAMSSRALSVAHPKSAMYRSLHAGDGGSVISWSADAFGRSKQPGWYHLNRKLIFAQRVQRADQEPRGCYISHSKYADEAVRISSTGRLAF